MGLLGLGTVGGGVMRVLHDAGDEITRRAGRPIEITRAAVRDVARVRDLPDSGIIITDRPMDVIDDPEIEVVIELIGGTEMSMEYVLAALERGKHVITANKALIALHGDEIFELAEKKGLMVAFEAAVAGGIPIIKLVREGLAANRIEWVAGIINGTSNYILTGMVQHGRSFAEMLAEAQQKGYAESDPALDVNGGDAAHKLTILASLAFGIPLAYQKIHVEGIEAIEAIDVANARSLGYCVKLMGIARRTELGIELRVCPTLVPEGATIAGVNGVLNAVQIAAHPVGSILCDGPGAGALPTASAVIADAVDVVRALTTDTANRVPHLAFQPSSINSAPIVPIKDTRCPFYLRLTVADRPGVLAEVTAILAAQQISIESIVQKGDGIAGNDVSVIIETQQAREGEVDAAIDAIEALDAHRGAVTRLRIEPLDQA
ncbi:homoserine dehydrogenase [Gammaproteobacteria bacterium]|nr:homoserine dehydrogenase [Gammaproteobacteria bacterium]